jgi:hypothetical protein
MRSIPDSSMHNLAANKEWEDGKNTFNADPKLMLNAYM